MNTNVKMVWIYCIITSCLILQQSRADSEVSSKLKEMTHTDYGIYRADDSFDILADCRSIGGYHQEIKACMFDEEDDIVSTYIKHFHDSQYPWKSIQVRVVRDAFHRLQLQALHSHSLLLSLGSHVGITALPFAAQGQLTWAVEPLHRAAARLFAGRVLNGIANTTMAIFSDLAIHPSGDVEAYISHNSPNIAGSILQAGIFHRADQTVETVRMSDLLDEIPRRLGVLRKPNDDLRFERRRPVIVDLDINSIECFALKDIADYQIDDNKDIQMPYVLSDWCMFKYIPDEGKYRFTFHCHEDAVTEAVFAMLTAGYRPYLMNVDNPNFEQYLIRPDVNDPLNWSRSKIVDRFSILWEYENDDKDSSILSAANNLFELAQL